MRAREIELQILSVMMDLFILNATILLFSYLKLGFEFQHPLDLYLVLLQANFSWVLAYAFVSKRILYSNRRYRYRLYRLTLRFLAYVVIFAIVYIPTRKIMHDLWAFLFEFSLIFYLVKVSFSIFFYKILAKRRKESLTSKRTLLVGNKNTLRVVRQIIESNPILQFRFVGFVAPENSNMSHLLGHCEQFESIVIEHRIEAVFAELEEEDKNDFCMSNDDLLHMCNRLGVRLYFVPKSDVISFSDHTTMSLDHLNIENPQHIPLDLVENQLKKRVFDLVFSFLVIVLVLSWMYPIIALLIKLESKGPVLFKQKRTGINQREFMCYKFRSMAVNEKADELQATKNDARITKVGNFLRKTNLDEFPQFINIFKGEMSVVGPRPHMLKHTDEYKKLVEMYLVRHYVKPGLTGWAQVNGFRGETDQLWKMKRRVDYDMEYIEEWSFDWDMEIIWKTLFSRLAFFNAG